MRDTMPRRFTRPEAELLVAAGRDCPSPETLRRVEARAQACSDARRLTRLCADTRTYGVVLGTLAALEHPPAFVRECLPELERLSTRSWFPKLRRLESARARIRDCFDRAALPYAFIRGLSLGERYYGQPWSRVSGDLDLLVPEAARGDALDLLQELGFAMAEPAPLAVARARYIGQAELRHAGWRVAVDLNWRLTGNAAIGSVCADMEEVWRRAACVRGAEYELSHEDVLWESVRHAAHGHDFGRNGVLLRTCVDAHAILREAGGSLDWDYLAYQARVGAFRRAWTLFASFYDECYAEPGDPRLGRWTGRPEGGSTALERSLFRRCVIKPRALVRSRNVRSLSELFHANLCLCAKTWCLDDAGRLASLARALAWPSDEELRLFYHDGTARSVARGRMAHWRNLLVVWPGIAAGCLLGIGFRGAARAWQCLRTPLGNGRSPSKPGERA